MTPLDDDPLHSLRERDEEPSRELDDRALRAGHAELSLATGPRWRALGTLAWTRVALPVGITVTVVGYLHWAFVAASAVYH